MKNRIIFKCFFVFFFFCISQNVFSQTNQKLKWFNPSDAAYPVIGNRGWQHDLQNAYDRFPARAEKMVRPDVWKLSQNSAGEYINFKTSASTIVVRYKVTGGYSMPHMPATGVSGVDLYARDINGKWNWAKGSWSFGDTIEYRFSNLQLSANEEEFRLYLPLYNSVTWMNIGVPSTETFTTLPSSDEQPIVVYGTSIMQGACATRPGLAWTNILNRKIDRSVVNLGFSGNGRLEQGVTDLMNELNAKLFVLDCMPNLVDSTQYSRQEIRKRILSSINSLREKHPHTPVLFAEHCCGLPVTNIDSSLVKKYKWSSNVLLETFTYMQKNGIKNIYLLTDEAIGFDEECTVDGTHPNDIGMMKYADAYEIMIRKIIKEESGSISTTKPVRQRRDHATYDFIKRHEDVLNVNKEKQPTVVFIGNSITHFWGGLPVGPIQNGGQSWEKYFGPLNSVNMGFGWDRIENVLWRVHHGELDAFTAKKIYINIGTNNLSINTDDEIITGLDSLVNAVKWRQANATFILSGIYPRRNMEERIAVLNKKIEALAKRKKISFINPGKELLLPNHKINDKFFLDGLHPNQEGYDKLAKIIAAVLN